MRFQVPQFIEVEDRIFGPLTLKQFIYLAGGAGFGFLLYATLPFILFFVAIIPVGGLAVGLAFFKINDQPFVAILESLVNYVRRPRLYLWKKEPRKAVSSAQTAEHSALVRIPSGSGSRLKNIAQALEHNKPTQNNE